MKKILLSILVVAPAFLFGQVTIITDNFDSYTSGAGVVTASAGIWDTWSGGAGTAEEALVSSAFSSSASNSMNVINGGPSVFLNDMILPFPATYTTGVYEFNFKLYIPQGNGGYFNLGGAWATGGATYEYGGDFFFNADGTGFADAPGTLVFAYNIAAWNTVKVRVNLGAATKELFINGVSIGSNAWGAPSGFGASDIFGLAYATGAATTQVTANFYVDDVTLINMTGVELDENKLDSDFSIYPSPNNGQFQINLTDAQSSNYSVIITDISGNIVHTSSIEVAGSATNKFDLDVASGMYFVNLSNGTNSITKKIAIK